MAGLRVILLGPPGAGKGTQAIRLATFLRVPRISSGDLFRVHYAQGTELGRLARLYTEKGALVPDDVTIKMVMEGIEDKKIKGGYLLDGFPRTLTQALALDEALVGDNAIDRAINLKVSEGELVKRLRGRVVCNACQTTYHRDFMPPKNEGVCDQCGSKLSERDDDKIGAIRMRLRAYVQETGPVLGHYRKAGILREVDGEHSVEKVSKFLVEALN